MNSFERLATAYRRVNVSVNVDRLYLDSGRWGRRYSDARESIDRLETPHTAPTSLKGDIACLGKNQLYLFQSFLSATAVVHLFWSRVLAPSRLRALLTGSAVSIGDTAFALELVFGRGHRSDMDVSPSGGLAFGQMSLEDRLDLFSHYGAVGLVAEFLPFTLAVHLNSRGHAGLAAASMAAAVLSRSALQPVRVAIAATAIATRVRLDFLIAIVMQAVIMGAMLVLVITGTRESIVRGLRSIRA